jgi:hypothetical protein
MGSEAFETRVERGRRLFVLRGPTANAKPTIGCSPSNPLKMAKFPANGSSADQE